jgi:hypothetical protein
MRSALLLITVLCSLSSYSQSVSGKVFDDKNKAARSVTVLLYRQSDSALVKSALTNNEGEFRFESVKAGRYAVRVTMVGHQPALVPLQVKDADVILSDIVLKPGTKVLQGVSVTGSKPFLEQRADKLVVNVEGSATAAGSTALEVLQKVPGVMVLNDKLTLVGKNSVMILIDGRPSPYQDMSQVLRDMPASNIEKIELITNPGAKYDASGGAVINIILKRNANLGMNGSVSLAGAVSIIDKKVVPVDRTIYRYGPAVSMNYRKNKLNVFGGYSFLHRNFFEYSEFVRDINTSRFFQGNYSPNFVIAHNFRFGMDYYADKKNTFGVLVRGFTRDNGAETHNSTEQKQISNGMLLSSFTTFLTQQQDRSNISGNLNWKHTFDTLGRDLNIDLDYATFQIDNSSNIITKLTGGGQSISNQVVDNPVKFGTVKIDYVQPLGKDAKLEMGAKASVAKIDNFLTFSRNNVIDQNRSNTFLYQENINAAYASFQKKLTDWEFIFGLRTEQTIAKGNSISTKVLDRDYWQLFPSAFITRKINKNFSTVAQYSRRVNRPSYQQQNPFTEYLDSLTYVRGNPLIKPETTDAAKFSLTYQGQPFLAVSYNKTSDVIFQNAPKQEGNLTYATPENLARYENVAIEINFPIKFGKKVTGFGGNQFVHNHYKADYLNAVYDQKKWNWIAYGQIAFRPNPTVSVETSFFYSTRFLNEFLILEPFGNLNFAVSKTFLERRLRIAVNVSDIFYNNNTKGIIDYQDIHLKYMEKDDTRSVRLAASYSFGNQKLKAARNRTTGSETETNRVKTN